MTETIKDMLSISKEEFEKKHEGELLYEEPTFYLRWVQKENEKVLQQLFTQRCVSGVIGDRYKEVWKDIPVIVGERRMKVKDYVKTLKKGEHKFNTVKVHLRQVNGDKSYVEEKEFEIERNENGLEQYTLCIKNCGGVYFPYLCMSGFYVKYYDFGYLKRKIIKDYGELEVKTENEE